MDQANSENETTSAKGAGGATNAEAGNAAAAEGAVSATRARRGGKVAPKQSGEGETAATSDRRIAKPVGAKTKSDPAAGLGTSKLDQLLALLRAPGGATLPELQSATGWQVHSVRGAMAGALRKKGHNVISEKPADGLRRYRIEEAS